MGYKSALEAAGFTIEDFKEFGSYQGDWFAITDNFEFITGSYGSCSGCDAFEAEFSYNDQPEERNGKYYKDWNEEITEEEYNQLKSEYQERLANFGRSYANSRESYEEIVARYKRKAEDEYSWDDDKEIYEWLLTLKK